MKRFLIHKAVFLIGLLCDKLEDILSQLVLNGLEDIFEGEED